MLTIEEAVKTTKQHFTRFYHIEVDCKNYILSDNERNRIIVFYQPTYIDYIRYVNIRNIKYFSKYAYMKRIMTFIRHCSFIKSIDDLIYLDRMQPELFGLINDIISNIQEGFSKEEIKIINEIIDALISNKDLSKVEFENENEEGIFNWALPYIYMFWATQDENGLIKISTEEAMKLRYHENNLLLMVQSKAIEYKKEIYERELNKAKRRSR